MTTKSFDANRRKKVYPAIRKSPVIRFESDTPDAFNVNPDDNKVFSTYLTPTETQIEILDPDASTTFQLQKTGIWETTPKTAMLNLFAVGIDSTTPIYLLGPDDVDDTITSNVFFPGNDTIPFETAVFGPLDLESDYRIYVSGGVFGVAYSWSLINVIEENINSTPTPPTPPTPSVPLGVATVWPAVADWAGLTAIENPRVGDIATVLDLGAASGFGNVIWSGSVWQLFRGSFTTVTALLGFNEVIGIGALAGVGETPYTWGFNNGPTPEWIRLPSNAVYQWPDVDTWGDLPSTVEGVVDGDTCVVDNIDNLGSTGIARWSGSQSEWQLLRGAFATITELLGFGEAIASGALAGVGSSDDETAVRYQYDGAVWARTPDANPYVWTLTSIATTDPSGIGVVRDGDIGELNGRIYVLVTLTKDAGAGGGTFQAWVDPVVETWTTPTVHATLIGTEANDTARLDVGWSTVLVGTGSVVPDVSGSGLSRLLSPAGSANSSEINCASGDILTASRVYFRAMIRAETAPAGVFEIAAMVINSSPDSVASVGQGTNNGQVWGILTNTWNAAGGVTTRVTPTAIGSVTPVLVEILRETTGYTELRVDGQTWQVAPSQPGSSTGIVKALSAAAPSTSEAWLDIGSAIVIVGS